MPEVGWEDEPQESGAIVAVHYGDYRRRDQREKKASGRRGARSDRAEQRFRDFLDGIGAELLEDEFLGVMYKHRTRCAAGHECLVTPNSAAARGRRGICRICARQDPATAESTFREQVVGLGGVVLEPSWLGSIRPHRVRCAAGHESAPTPGNVARGQGICGKCGGNDPEEARQRFYDAVAGFGATVLDDVWRGVDALHAVRCASGHIAQVCPSTLKKGMDNICAVCRGRTPAIVEAKFRARIDELGGEVLESTWLGSNARHRVRCPASHVTSSRPDQVLRGIGMCHFCAGRSWDVFYVVANPGTSTLKFGITSGDPRPRLADHALNGFRQVDLLLTALGGGAALSIERAVRVGLRAAGHRPVRGSEYFDLGVRESVFVTAATVLARGPVTLLTGRDDEAYDNGWANGRRALVRRIEELSDEQVSGHD